MQLFLSDSRSKQKRAFAPQNPPFVTMYVCGPTVYDDAHLGHARSAVCFDLLYRLLGALGYSVRYARNITDIDDKIIEKARQTGQSLQDLTLFYKERYERDMKALNVLPPDLSPHATQNIDAMQDLAARLLQNQSAYKTSSGDVYLDTSKDKGYGSLSGKTQEDTRSRVEAGEKKHERDFAVWKGAKADETVFFKWDLGRGRPGWHLECAAMIKRHLDTGGEFMCDIHGGGQDLFFPHHENEASQCRCAYGRELAAFWLHNGFVKIDGEKMSKSLGNSFFLKDALKLYHGEVLRFYLLSSYYRNDFNFNTQDLDAAAKRLEKLYRLKMRAYAQEPSAPNAGFKDELLSALCDDLNVSVALSALDLMIKNANDALEREPKNKPLMREIAANIELVSALLGVGSCDPYEFFQWGVDEALKIQIEDLIKKRAEAKSKKDFKLADELRSKLRDLGVQIMDTPTKVLWEKF